MFIISTFTVGITRIMEYATYKSSRGVLVVGILNLIFGFIFVFNFFVTVVFMPLLESVWILVWGIFEIETSIRTRGVSSHWWIFLLIGILSVILGFYMMFNLGFAINVLAWYFGLYFIVVGIAEIISFFVPDNKDTIAITE